MSLREAAQQALEALELHAEQYPHMQKGYTVDAITALRAALERPEQEPVAWMVYTQDGKSVTDNPADFIEWRSFPLFTHPPRREWRSLSEEEMGHIYVRSATHEEFARAIEAKLKEINT